MGVRRSWLMLAKKRLFGPVGGLGGFLGLAEFILGLGSELLLAYLVQSIGDVGREGFEQAHLFGIENTRFCGINGHGTDYAGLPVQRKGGGCAEPATQGSFPPRRSYGIRVEVVVDHHPVFANAGAGRAFAQFTLQFNPDFIEIIGGGAARGRRDHAPVLYLSQPNQGKFSLLGDNPADLVEQ